MSEQDENVEEVKLLGEDQKDLISTIFLYCLTFFFFILPIKFGGSVLPTTQPSYPENLLFISWPPYFLTIMAGVILIASIVIYRPNRISKNNLFIVSSWTLLCLATTIFGYYKFNLGYYLYSINQALIALMTGLVAAICLSMEPRSRRFIIGGICGGLIFTILNGLHQYLWGFAENIKYFEEMAAQGVHFPDAHVSRIMQKLVFSHFTISNSFAAHIILVLPLTIYILLTKLNKKHIIGCRVFGTTLLLFSLTNWFTHGHPTLSIITLIAGMILCFGLDHASDNVLKTIGHILILLCLVVLALTRSRAGIICFIAGLTFAGAVCGKGNIRKGCIALLIIGIGVGAYYAPKIGSFQVRLGYYESLAQMFKEDPMGYGFGGFSEFYNKNKGAGIEESNVPHSFFFGYLGHGGIFAGLAVLFIFIAAIRVLVRQKIDTSLKFCLLSGFSAWYFHSQLDFNIMIPGTVAIASMLIMLSQKDEDIPATKSYAPFFTALIPLSITVIYFCVQHTFHQREYTSYFEMVKDIKSPPPIDKVKNEMERIAYMLPYSTAHYDEAASWAMKNYDSLKKSDQIQKENYLILAEGALQKAVEINPKRSSFFTRLARISFERKNFDQTRAMLNKAFELYPFNSSALSLERHILTEWRLREPQNPSFTQQLLANEVKRLEISLGHMRFHDHLLLSQNQIESMYKDLDKRISELYTEIGLIKKVGMKVDTDSIIRQLKEIHTEAQNIAGVDR